nr:hypothetical protein [Spirochaetota bacterium]
MASNETKYRVNMDRDWGIDLAGRKMRYSPYHTDREKNYTEPNESEIADIYEISGEAVSETLLYFEDSGGETGKLVKLLNNHMPDKSFFVNREILLDNKRWWNNEFYFYFIMFCKKLIGRYDWRFGEN